MVIGAALGRAVGMLVQAIQRANPQFWGFASCPPDIDCVTPGVYAIIGAAFALGGVTRMTVSLVVIMFELTGALTYVLPIMISVMVSKWVGDIFGKQGIYEAWIGLEGYPYLEKQKEAPCDMKIAEIMTKVDELIMIPATGNTLDSLCKGCLTRYNC